MSPQSQKVYPLERRPAFATGLLLSFVVIFGVACIVAYQSYTKAITATIRSNETRATLLAKLILEHQRAAIGVLQSYADRPLLVDSVKKRDFEGTLKQFIDLAKHNPEMESPFIANPDSTVWVNYPVDRQVMNKDLSHRDWYKGVSKEWKPYISSSYKRIVGEKDLAVAVTVPILDQKGKVIGILGTAQSAAFFRKIIGEVGLNLDAKITLIDQQGHIIYSNGFLYTKEIIGYPPLEFVGKVLKGKRGDVRVRDASDQDRIKYVSFAPVEGTGWSIIVEKTRSEVLQSETSHFALIGVMAFLTYGVVVLSLVHLREWHRQIKGLERLNEELDGRVRERTAELEAGNKALRESEERLRRMIETSPVAIGFGDSTGRIFDANESFYRLTGYTREEIRDSQLGWDRLTAPEYAEIDRQIMATLAATGSAGPYEKEYIRKDGSRVPLLLSVSKLPGRDEHIAFILDITERKRAEEERERLLIAVREEKDRLLALINSIQDEVWFADTEKNFTLVNPSALREFGFNGTTDIDVRKFVKSLEVYHPDGTPRPVEEAQPLRALQGEVVTNEEEIIRSPRTGELRVRQVSATPVKDAGGHIIGSLSVVRDITKLKRAEEQVSRSQKTFVELVERSPFGTYVVDSQFRIAMMNAASQEGAFRNVRPVIGRDFSEAMRILWPEPVAAEIIGHFGHTLETGEPYYSLPFVNPRHDVGIVESYEWELHRIMLPEGQYGVICYYYDSTKLREAETALRLTQASIDGAAEMVAWFRPDGSVYYVNDATCRTLGYSREELLKMNALDFSPGFTKEQYEEHWREVRARKSLTLQPVHRRKDGSTYTAEVLVNHMVYGGREFLFAYGRDITDRKRAEEALQEQTLELQHLTGTLEERVKERTAELANLSSQLVSAQENERKRVSYDLHDNVWQALLAIRFEIDGLFSGQGDWAALQEKAKEVKAAIFDLVGKIRSMQGDLWPYVLDDIGLAATIDWYCREFKKGHSGLTIESHVNLGEREIPSSAKIVIYRVMQEAMSNVTKHSQANHVSLSLINKDHRVEFTIQDNGIGFDPVETMIRKTPWGGLGLLNIKARTELSGGIFGVESSKGRGTTVRATWSI